MALIALLALVAVAPQEVKPFLDEPVPGGLREIILGLSERPRTNLALIYQKENAPIIGPDNIVPGGIVEATLGYTRWDVTIGLLRQTQVRILRSDAFSRQQSEADGGAQQSDTWWVDPDGKILRHVRVRVDARGAREADCAYREDRIDVTRRQAGKAEVRETFPAPNPMKKLHDRFLPMVDGDNVKESKEFVDFDPFTGKFVTMTLTKGGRFDSGRDTDTRGALGHYYDLKGPGVPTQRIFLAFDGKVSRVELPRFRVLVPR